MFDLPSRTLVKWNGLESYTEDSKWTLLSSTKQYIPCIIPIYCNYIEHHMSILFQTIIIIIFYNSENTLNSHAKPASGSEMAQPLLFRHSNSVTYRCYDRMDMMLNVILILRWIT